MYQIKLQYHRHASVSQSLDCEKRLYSLKVILEHHNFLDRHETISFVAKEENASEA